MIRSLIHIYSPPYLISALAALAALHPDGRVRADVLLQLPGASQETSDEILGVVRELAAGHSLIGEVHGLSDEMLAMSGPVRVFDAQYDEFYYAHDSTGTICRRIAATYPDARRVCIGDAFGMVYPANFVAGYGGSLLVDLRRKLRLLLRGEPNLRPICPDVAALVLPVDPSGQGLVGIPLKCCSRSNFVDAIEHCHRRAVGLSEYMRDLLADAGGKRPVLLLTENYSESGHMSPMAEVEMYAEIICRHCAPGANVLVKPHPLEGPEKSERLQAILGTRYAVRAMAPRFRRYPIEIWRELVLSCEVICTAYPVLSLKYAYGIDVLQPLDDEMIGRWIAPSAQAWIRDGLSLYSEPLARLAKWDGASVLWSKPQ